MVLPQGKVRQVTNILDSEIVLETQYTDMANLSNNEGKVRSDYENARRPQRALDFDKEEVSVTGVGKITQFNNISPRGIHSSSDVKKRTSPGAHRRNKKDQIPNVPMFSSLSWNIRGMKSQKAFERLKLLQ